MNQTIAKPWAASGNPMPPYFHIHKKEDVNMAEITLDDVRKAKQDKAAAKAVEALSDYVNCLTWESRNFCVLMSQ